MRGVTILFITAHLFGCSTPYTWQDTRQPVREDATVVLEECRSYASEQYKPGIPMGDALLDEARSKAETTENHSGGEWRPDQSPFRTTNVNAQPIHEVPVDYTGYPGELDYYPSYLDDILEKCMLDRGWVYKPAAGIE